MSAARRLESALQEVDDSHKAKVQGGSGVVWGCSCGWESEPFRSDLKTEDQWRLHAAAAAWFS